MKTPDGYPDRHEFLNLAGLFQGGMVLGALGLAWLLNVNPWDTVAWDAWAVLVAAAAVLPLCGLSWWLDRSSLPAARTLRDLWGQTLGPVVSQSPWWELVLLALLVGVSEELLFRGVLQMWLSRWTVVGALLVTNVVFAACHALTPAYAALAGLVGLYLGCSLYFCDPPNLLVPVLCHSGCDLFSFCLIRRRVRRTL